MKISRKQKALLLLPLAVIPFLTLAFWALGGGAGEGRTQNKVEGLNLQLPEARLKDGGSENKMSFYDEAEKDSARATKDKGEDRSLLGHAEDSTSPAAANKNSATPAPPDPPLGTNRDANEEKVYQKLAQLNNQLARSTATHHNALPLADYVATNRTTVHERSNPYSGSVKTGKEDATGTEDSDLKDINGLMEKVLDIQHPERVNERLQEKSRLHKRDAFPVRTQPFMATVSLLDSTPSTKKGTTQFYESSTGLDHDGAASVGAVVDQDQRLVDGAVIKFRLTDDVFINAQAVAKGTTVYGIVSISGERLACTIPSIRSGAHLLPVNLQVFDLDGLPGLYIPGAITREVAKASVDNAAQLLEVTSLDPSLKAQATSTGLSAVKSLLTKKAKRINVFVRGGYRVLLKSSGGDE